MKPKIALIGTVLVLVLLGLLSYSSEKKPRTRKTASPFEKWHSSKKEIVTLSEAENGKPEVQFNYGMQQVNSNIVLMVIRVPHLEDLPFVGHNFRKVRFELQRAESNQVEVAKIWVAKAAQAEFPPAVEAMGKLFGGTEKRPTPGP
jgi:hypothetical protein